MTKKKKKKSNKIIKVFLGFSLIIVVVAAMSFLGLYFSGIGPKVLKLRQEAVSIVRDSSIETFQDSQTTLVYDTNGEEITKLKGDKGIYYINSQRIPTYVKNAFITIEDKKFYSHNGVDYKAMIRAAISILKHQSITQGASTITQQLSRNMFLTNRVSWERKVEEIFIAQELEKIYSKSAILEFYLNNIYFANGYYGIQAASMGYFSKDVNDLTLSEIAFLTAIPNNPTLYNPMNHMDNTIGRRNRILSQMLTDGKITQEEYENAKQEDIVLNVNQEKSVKHNYAETYIYYSATRALMEARGFTFQNYFNSKEEEKAYQDQYDALYTECQNALYTKGYRVYTSMDLNLQEKLQYSIDDVLYAFVSVNDDGIYNMQASATCIDNKTGNVVAIIGGRSQESDVYTLNRAYQSFRQPGSSIKPLIVYAPAFEKGYTPDSVMLDEPIENGPKNYGGGYAGSVSLRYAVMKSTNTIAWKLLDEITPSVGLSFLKEMNFAKIEKDDYRNVIALGGFTTGVSSVEMAAGFATLENDGFYRNPTCITKITTANGEVLYQNSNESKQIYKENTARITTDVLTSVMTEGTGKGLRLKNITTAGKTGTTNDYKDGWFVGYSSYYTTSVWVGCDMPKEVEGLTGASYPGKIWHNFMEEIHTGLEDKSFTPYVNYTTNPKGIKTAKDYDTNVTEDTPNTDVPPDAETQNEQQNANRPPDSYFENQH